MHMQTGKSLMLYVYKHCMSSVCEQWTYDEFALQSLYIPPRLTYWGLHKVVPSLADDTFKYNFVNENVLISIKN